MPSFYDTSKYFESQGCSYNSLQESAKLTQSMFGTVVDVQKEYNECVKRVMKIAEDARQAALEQQAYNRTVLYIIVAAIIAVCILAFIYRKPIRQALENVFVGAAAKTIRTKRDLKNYREDIAQRVRDKSDS